MLYPELPQYGRITVEDLPKMYMDLVRYSTELKFLLEQRDAVLNNTPATTVYTVTTVTNISRAREGDISYSTSTGKFRGYVSSTGWVNLN